MPELRTCQKCGKEFKTFPVRIRQGKAKYCSNKCSHRIKAACHPERPHFAKGLCESCYQKAKYKRTATTRNERLRVNYLVNGRAKLLSKLTGRPCDELKAELVVLLEKQKSCEICGSTDNLVVDHNHGNGKIRGILCRNHNAMLGFAKESTDIFRDAIRYLMRKDRVD